MKQEDIERLISLNIDDELAAEDRQKLATIMANQPEYATLRDELLDQKKQCKTPVPAPSPQLFEALRQRVAKKYAPPATIYRLSFNAKLAAAAALILAFFAGYFVPRQLSPQETLASFPQATELEENLVQAKTEYLSAINRLETLAEAHLQHMPPEVAVQVANNLKVVDRAIAACENFANAYPNQYVAHASLAKAYQAKVDLLQTLVEGSFARS